MIRAVRSAGAAVIVAPPGSGKTTRVPPALLDVIDGQILVLQPRRVAARLTATRIAAERGWTIGHEVGWRVRFENRTRSDTRLVVLTEGLLTRRLQRDPFLEGVGAVILDEVHERSVHGDLALALLTELRRDARPDLVVIAMSATLDPGPLADLLGAPIIEAHGRNYPVDIVHRADPGPLPERVSRAVRSVLDDGPVLVFLAGRRDISRCAQRLGDLRVPVLPLHGGLTLAQQEAALAPSPGARVVLATNIAETSVTLPGVRAVVDAGDVKVTRFDVALGVERLVRERVSAASADQRAGRAGRTGPGTCLRLWPQGQRLVPYLDPELLRSDLAPVLLQVHIWGTQVTALPWLTAPPDAALARANALLERLGAVADGALTAHGRILSELPMHPRLGTVLVAAHAAGRLHEGALAAALASEPDPFRDGVPGAAHADDLLARLEALSRGGGGPAARRVRQVGDQLKRAASRALGPSPPARGDPHKALVLAVLSGFPDRLGRRSGDRRYRLDLGAARLSDSSLVDNAPLVVGVGVRGADPRDGATHTLDIACPIPVDWVPTTSTEETAFRDGAVVSVRTHRFGDTVVREQITPAHDDALIRRYANPEHLSPSPAAQTLLDRVAFVVHASPELALTPVTLDDVLDTVCQGRRTLKALGKADVHAAVTELLTWQTRQALDQLAPTHLTLPTGSRVRVHYLPGGPRITVRVQQVLGLRETPTVAGGRVRVTVALCSPANRVVQVTQDLPSFWRTGYPEVRRDLRGRYPKHAWPEDPLTATAQDHPRRSRRR